MEHPESEIRDISSSTGIHRQLVKYHIDNFIKNGLLIKKNLKRLILYSCTIEDEETKIILEKADDIIIELFYKINSIGANNSKEVVKALISAYVDVALENEIEIKSEDNIESI